MGAFVENPSIETLEGCLTRMLDCLTFDNEQTEIDLSSFLVSDLYLRSTGFGGGNRRPGDSKLKADLLGITDKHCIILENKTVKAQRSRHQV